MLVSEIYDINKGSLQSSKCIKGEYPFITAAEKFKNHNSYSHDCEALIFACAASGSLGRTHYFNGKFISSDLCFILTPKIDFLKKVVPKFHYYYLNANKDEIVRKTKTGTSKAAINKSNFSKVQLPLPSVEVQQKIVEQLEEIITKQNKIKSLNTFQEKDIKNILFSFYFDLIKGAKLMQMKEVAPIIRRPIQINTEKQYPELGIRCFGNGTFHKPALSGLEVGTKKLFQIKTGDLVFSNVFAWEGGIAVAQEEDNNRYGSHRFISCNCDLKQVLPEYLNFHFLTPKGLEEIVRCSPGGAGRNKTLGLKKLEAIKVPVPDIEEQRKFVALLHQFKQLEKQRVEREKELAELIPSLLDKAFKGELVCNEETESIAIAAEPKASYAKAESLIPKNKRGFAKQVLGGKIVSLFKDDKNFTNIKFQKLQYLAEHIAEEDLNWNYYKQSAGPYDNKFMHSVFNKLRQNQWFGSSNYKFYPLQKADKIEGFYQGYFGEKTEKLSELFKLLRNASEKFCEAVATIYAVWNNHIIMELPFDKAKIKKDFFEWSNRKEIVFSDDEFEKALVWMNKHDIAPTGFGNLIKEKK